MKHGIGKAIKRRMRRIMKENHILSQQLPTQEARNKKALEKTEEKN